MRRLGRYWVGRLLGSGGAGQVYEAVLEGPAGFRMPVALKVLTSGTGAVRREARIGGLLRHENLVDVYEVGEVDGQWFLALERCRGSLAEELPLPPRAVVDAGLQVCAALAYAHEALELVHLDLKPSNLLFTDDGVLKVADLGIAEAEGFVSRRSRIRGTRGYMAPEQAAGGEVDHRADLYALGVTLVELATGSRPGASTTMALETADDSHPVTVEPGDGWVDLGFVPDWLRPIVARCLAPDLADRWPDMSALARALEALDVSGASLASTVGVSTFPVQYADHVGAARPEPFVGREALVERVVEGLASPRVLTLRGPGGIGKSRLAREVLEHQDGVFCSLADVRTEEGLVFAVARALRLRLSRGDGLVRVGRALARRGPVVVVLDNFEQILALGVVVRRWRQLAPEVRWLVTSRRALGLEGEAVVDVPPLPADAGRELVILWASQRGVAIADDPDLDALVERLDGLPLALELAAGRLGVLSVADVLERLGLGLLRSGSADRHGALRATLEWSWTLLDPTARDTLAQLSVFAGGFTLEAAEVVVRIEGRSVLDAVGELVDHSMVRSVGGGRFELLQTIQVFAAEKLAEPAEAEARHRAWFAGLYRGDGVSDREGMGRPAELERVMADIDNLFLACQRSVAAGEVAEAYGSLAVAWSVMGSRGPFRRTAELARQVAELTDPPHVRAALIASSAVSLAGEVRQSRDEVLAVLPHAVGRDHAAALNRLAVAQRFLGELDASAEALDEALVAHRAHGNTRLEAVAVDQLGIVRRLQGDPEQALALHQRSRELAARIGDRRYEGIALGHVADTLAEMGQHDRALALYREALAIHRSVDNRHFVAVTLTNLGVTHRERNELAESRQCYEQALAMELEDGDLRGAAVTQLNLGNVDRREGRLDAAEVRYREALEGCRHTGNRYDESITLGNLGILAWKRGQAEEAVARLGQAIEVAEAIGVPRLQYFWRVQRADYQLADDPDAARAGLDRAWELLVDHDPFAEANGQVVEGLLALRLGDEAGARRALERAEAVAPPGNIPCQEEIDRLRLALAGG